jgi:hypothetical protein
MDPISALALSVAILKLIVMVMDFLHAHPAIGQEVHDVITKVTGHLADALDQLGSIPQFQVEAP